MGQDFGLLPEHRENEYLVTGCRAALRPMTLEDCEDVRRWRNDPRVRSQYLHCREITEEEEIAYFHEKVESGKVLHLIICDLDRGGKGVGCQVFNDIVSYREDPDHIPVEVGFFIGDDSAVGTGIAGEAMQNGIRYVFENLGVKSCFSRIFASNLPSIRTCERVGMEITADLPQVPRSDGSYADMVELRITPERLAQVPEYRKERNQKC